MSREINDNIVDPIEIQRMKKALSKTIDKKKMLRKVKELQKVYSVSQICRLSGVRPGTIRMAIYSNTERVGTYNYVLISNLHAATAKMLKTVNKRRKAIAMITGKPEIYKEE